MTSTKTITKSAVQTGFHSPIKMPPDYFETFQITMERGFNLPLFQRKSPHTFNLPAHYSLYRGESADLSQEKS